MKKFLVILPALLLTTFLFTQPVINSFTPASGSVGSPVTITGTGFSTTLTNNIVFFGAVKATVVSATATQLVVAVPAGATYQPISVTNNKLTCFSTMPFIATFQSDAPLMTPSSFGIDGTYQTGSYPFDVTIKDLNDDGKPDILVVNSTGGSFSVLKNKSTLETISFETKQDYTVGPDPKRIATGDLDGDGKPDVVVSNMNSGQAGTISVFNNTSSGGTISFASKIDYSAGDGSIGLQIADMDSDGKPDIVVASGNSGYFSIFRNTTTVAGSVTFASKQDIPQFFHPDNIFIADLDKDGKLDLATANFSNNTISVFRNISTVGSISFNPKLDFAVLVNPTYVTAADFDGDGKPDIAVSNYSSGTISLFKNNSSAGVISLGAREDYSQDVLNIAVSDLNGDGKVDLCTGRKQNGSNYVMQNIFTGGNFAFGMPINFTTGSFDTYTDAGDLNGDGKPELVVANTTQNRVTVLRNKISDPVIANVSNSSANRGATIVINGTNFTNANSVKFGGTPAASFTVVSSTRIDAITGAGSSGDITVTTPSGTGKISNFSFIPEISAGSAITFCSPSSVTLTSSADNNNQWYKDGLIIIGAVNKTFQASTNGTYTVKNTSNAITTTSANSINVNVTTVVAPAITFSNSNLVSSATAGNQWYLNGTAINGATGVTYKPLQTGNYTVTSTTNGCTSAASPSYNFVLTGLIDLGNNQYINLYPIPVKDILNLNWNITGNPLLTAEIINFNGKMVLRKENVSSYGTLDLSRLQDGIYLIKIYNTQLKINKSIKIVKGN